MGRVLAFGGAAAMLLQIIEQLVPASRVIPPLGGSGFVQTAGIVLGFLAFRVMYDLLFGDRNSEDDKPPML